MTKHVIGTTTHEGWNSYSRSEYTKYTGKCDCGWVAPYGRNNQRDAIGDGMVHMDEMSKIDPDMTIYDVLLELIDAHAWASEAIKLRRVKAVQNARDNKVFGVEGNFKL
jgi:hypothetical protein